MKMSKSAKIEQLIEWLEESSERFCQDQDGYPDVVERVGTFVVVATVLNGGEPHQMAYSNAQCVEWYDDIVAYLHDEDTDNMTEAIEETRPHDYRYPPKLASSKTK